MSDSLPPGWVIARLADIADIMMGSSPPGSSYNTDCNGVPLVNGPAEFGAGPLDRTLIRQFTTQPTVLCKEGDLLLCVRGSTTGRTNIAGFEAAIGRGVAAIRALIFQPFLNYYIASQREHILALGTGSTFPNIRSATISNLPIAVPPFPEQQRIATKIDQLFSDLDSGIDALEKAAVNLKSYRDAILKAAVAGSLTAEWRSSRTTLETGSQLLARILVKRRQQWEAKYLDRFRAAKRTPPTNWHDKYAEPEQPNSSDLPELPPGWCWTALDSIADVAGGITKNQKRSRKATKEVPYLRVANVQRGYLNLEEVKTIHATPDEIAELHLQNGDILFTEGGDRDKLGRGWVWQGELPECIHQNHIFRARLIDSSIQPQFISHHGNTFGREWFTSAGKQTTNLASINLRLLRRFPVPIPPAAEQRQIIAEVDRHLSAIDVTLDQVNRDMIRANELKHDIYRRAFEGTLVPQEPDEEPATVLLEQIRRERLAKARTMKPQRKANSPKVSVSMSNQQRRRILEVLKEHPKGLTPEALLRESGYDLSEIDDFYSELRSIGPVIEEERPHGIRTNKWPKGAKILLRARGE